MPVLISAQCLVGSYPVETVINSQLLIQAADKQRTCVSIEARSMPQANLREYFLNDYKSGGAFEHDAYEHDAADWCWIHKRSGIKARPLQFDAFHTSCCHVVTQFCCRFRPTSSSSSCQVWQDALDLTQSGGSGEVECLFHYTTQLGFWNITAPSKKAVEVFVLHLVWIHVVGATTPAPLRQPQTA